MKYINLKNMKRKIIGKQNNMILNKIKNEVISFLKESTKNPKILLKKICKYGLIIALFFCIIMTGVHGHLIIVKNQEKSNLEGELGEINIFRAQLEDIAIKYDNFIYDLLEKDFEVNKSIEDGEINDKDAINILSLYSHRSDIIFAKFILTSDFSRYAIYINYNILEFFTNVLIPTWYNESAYHLTSDLINFEIIISKNDNESTYLNRSTYYGHYDLTVFESKNLITEYDVGIFSYHKTWEILYNYSYFGVVNIDVNFPLFDRIVEFFYIAPLLRIEINITTFEIYLNYYSTAVILLGIIVNLDYRQKKKFNKSYSEDI